MCTLSILALPVSAELPTGYRLVFNRDEAHDRPPGLPPQCRTFGGRQALLPIDSQAGGTWIGVNETGLALCLQNRNPDFPPRQPPQNTRGDIIPDLLHLDRARDAGRQAAELDVSLYAPFRLICVDTERVVTHEWDGRDRRADEHALGEDPFLFCSSSLGDHLVDPPRRRLFAEMVVGAPEKKRLAAQDAFQRHRWPEHPELSVNMWREDAGTVSLTEVTVWPTEARMRYLAGSPDDADAPVELVLPRRSPSTR